MHQRTSAVVKGSPVCFIFESLLWLIGKVRVWLSLVGCVKIPCCGDRLEALPWKSWPNDPAEDESTEFETGMDALARHTLHSSFPKGLPVSCHSSFVSISTCLQVCNIKVLSSTCQTVVFSKLLWAWSATASSYHKAYETLKDFLIYANSCASVAGEPRGAGKQVCDWCNYSRQQQSSHQGGCVCRGIHLF